jgi:hypothetical protein
MRICINPPPPAPLPAPPQTRFPTVVMFVSGPAGAAAARALLESPPDVADLALELRGDVVVYYSVRPLAGR